MIFFFKDWTNNLKLERCKICFKFPWAWIVLACVLQIANMTRVAQIMSVGRFESTMLIFKDLLQSTICDDSNFMI